MSELQLDDLSMHYGNTPVVRGVDLAVRSGEFMVLVGPSGCGKSTTLRMIAGLEEPSGGCIRIGGHDVTGLPPDQRGVAMVFQSYALYPHMTVEENMGFGLRMAGAKAADVRARVQRAAQSLQLQTLLARRPRELSGGQRQRVAIGRAIVREPKVFLFDEPLSNLDAALRTQMRAELAQLHKRLGATIVYVTHDQVEAMTLGERIALFNAGRIEQVGAPLELYDRPCNRYVAGFLGSPCMNFLSAHAAAPWLDADARAPGRVASVGVRPEHLHWPPKPGQPALAATVQRTEHLGDVALLHCGVEASEVPLILKTALAPRELPSTGDVLHLGVLPERLMRFDEQGCALVVH